MKAAAGRWQHWRRRGGWWRLLPLLGWRWRIVRDNLSDPIGDIVQRLHARRIFRQCGRLPPLGVS